MSDNKTSNAAKAGTGTGIVAVFLFLVVMRYVNKKPTDIPAPVRPHPVATSHFPAGNPLPGAGPVGRLHVHGRDATAELQQFVTLLSFEEKLALGDEVVRTGLDTYAASIRLHNTGTIPLRVSVQNLRVHFGGELATVTAPFHPRFLKNTVLSPGAMTEGLVLYRARVDIGAAMRAGRGGVSYQDPGIIVTYSSPILDTSP